MIRRQEERHGTRYRPGCRGVLADLCCPTREDYGIPRMSNPRLTGNEDYRKESLRECYDNMSRYRLWSPAVPVDFQTRETNDIPGIFSL